MPYPPNGGRCVRTSRQTSSFTSTHLASYALTAVVYPSIQDVPYRPPRFRGCRARDDGGSGRAGVSDRGVRFVRGLSSVRVTVSMVLTRPSRYRCAFFVFLPQSNKR